MRRAIRLGMLAIALVPFGWCVWCLMPGATYAPGQEKLTAPRVLQIRTQTVGETIYFHVQLENVADWPPARWAELNRAAFQLAGDRPLVPVTLLAGAPRLVGLDGVVESAYLVWEDADLRRITGEIAEGGIGPNAVKPRPTAPQEPVAVADADARAPRQLHFVGRLRKRAQAKCSLIYTCLVEQEVPHPFREKERLKIRWPMHREIPITLDFSQSAVVPRPNNPVRHYRAASDDLEGLFAFGQGQFFAIQGWLAKDQGLGFYELARILNNRRYGTTVGALFFSNGVPGEWEHLRRQFELVTGAAAIGETLQLRRFAENFRSISQAPRTVDVSHIRGIDVPEVNWHALLKDKKEPVIEPLAQLVPRDQYYVHFSQFARFLEAGDLLEQWGGPILQAFRLAGQDYRLRERYERQLCLKSTALAKLFGPAVVESVAITGSDLYLREGSDVSVLFRVKNTPLFLAAVNSQVAQARKVWGDQLKEAKSEYQGLTIESFVTPLREVSAYRCILGDNVVVYSNSPVAIRRIIDTAHKKLPALASSNDFRYMRTVFQCNDANEDAFLFFSDEFLRALLGPATRIKESRRVEALTSLYMLQHAALYAAWETGKLPATHQELLQRSGLKESELYQPEGKELRWDGERQLAISDAYNTIHFATPLIELPIDKVTEREKEAYEQFRLDYVRLWTGAFDPVGLRLRIRPQEVTAETYILPLINSPAYRNLRREFGGKTAKFDLDRLIPPEGIVYWLVHWPETSFSRQLLRDLVRPNLRPNFQRFFQAIGDIALLGLHDDPFLAELAETALLSYMLGTMEQIPEQILARNVMRVPVVAGLEVKNPFVFAAVLSALKALIDNAAPQMLSWGPLEKEQHGYKIVAIRPVPNSEVDRWFNPEGTPEKDRFTPGIYYTTVGNMFYVSLREDVLRQMVDRYVAQKKQANNNSQPAQSVEAHMVLHLSPQAAKRLWPVAQWYVETEIAASALTNTTLLYPLWRARIIPPDARDQQVFDAAYRFYGFAPISPDRSTVIYDEKRDVVVNERHGSLADPWFPRQPAPDSPLGQLLESLRALRAQLEFREDGAFTVLTIQRQHVQK